MENIELNSNLARSNAREQNGLQGDLQKIRAELFADPAAFFVFHLVFVRFNKVSELKSYLSATPDILEIVDSILSRMEEAAIVRLVGDLIERHSNWTQFDSMEELRSFVPNTFRIAADRVLENEQKTPELRKARSEMARYIVVPDAPEIAEELREMNSEYKARMLAIQSKVARGEYKTGHGIRFVGIVDSVLEAEDFV